MKGACCETEPAPDRGAQVSGAREGHVLNSWTAMTWNQIPNEPKLVPYGGLSTEQKMKKKPQAIGYPGKFSRGVSLLIARLSRKGCKRRRKAEISSSFGDMV